MSVKFQAVPPQEAIDYFRSKGFKPSFNWRDMWQEEHAYAFTVAKAMRMDILNDIRAAVDDALAKGIAFDEFQKQVAPTLQKKGWWGKKLMVDPKTGEEKLVQLGSARRLQIIYDTNLRSAYAAGRWEQIQRVKKTRPYLRYMAVLDERTRQSHRQWHNTILPVDDPFWNDHYPPNGWRCRCKVQQLSERDLKRYGLKVSDRAPILPGKKYIDKRNGQVLDVPGGIDPGFAFNAGVARMKALSPPPLNRSLKVPFAGPLMSVNAPSARPVDPYLIMPDGLKDEEYVRAFLKDFGADIGKPVVFYDKAGEPLIISDDLFKTAAGEWKIKRQRHRYMRLLAQSIQDPDEILWQWEEYPKGQMTLTRTYLTKWQDEQSAGGYSLFTTSQSGWSGVTSFQAKDQKYIEKRRQGVLVYQKKK